MTMILWNVPARLASDPALRSRRQMQKWQCSERFSLRGLIRLNLEYIFAVSSFWRAYRTSLPAGRWPIVQITHYLTVWITIQAQYIPRSRFNSYAYFEGGVVIIRKYKPGLLLYACRIINCWFEHCLFHRAQWWNPFGWVVAYLSRGPGLNTFGIGDGTLCVLRFGCKWVRARCHGRTWETLAQFSQRPITSKRKVTTGAQQKTIPSDTPSVESRPR